MNEEPKRGEPLATVAGSLFKGVDITQEIITIFVSDYIVVAVVYMAFDYIHKVPRTICCET